MNKEHSHIMQPFDLIAEHYDEWFEENLVTKHIRPIVQESLLSSFAPGSHVLEINCGTGTDAIALAERGIYVTAIDSSPNMIQQAQSKITSHNVEQYIDVRVMDYLQIDSLGKGKFDGAFSNFGGLNCTSNLSIVLDKLAHIMKPEATFIACVLNKYCLWEILSFLMRGNMQAAFRRFRSKGIQATIGQQTLNVWYYSPSTFARLLSPWFEVSEMYGLNIFSPSPNSRAFITSSPQMTHHLLALDNKLSHLPPFSGLGDHFVMTAKRTAS